MSANHSGDEGSKASELPLEDAFLRLRHDMELATAEVVEVRGATEDASAEVGTALQQSESAHEAVVDAMERLQDALDALKGQGAYNGDGSLYRLRRSVDDIEDCADQAHDDHARAHEYLGALSRGMVESDHDFSSTEVTVDGQSYEVSIRPTSSPDPAPVEHHEAVFDVVRDDSVVEHDPFEAIYGVVHGRDESSKLPMGFTDHIDAALGSCGINWLNELDDGDTIRAAGVYRYTWTESEGPEFDEVNIRYECDADPLDAIMFAEGKREQYE